MTAGRATRADARVPSRQDMARQLMGSLRSHGVDTVFGVPGGGSNLDVVGAAEASGCRFVLTHTETAAAIMAGVTAELSGRLGACVATRGPGAASAVNGVAQAHLDRQPIVVVTDCVSSGEYGRVSHQRLDQEVLFAAATKASVRWAAGGRHGRRRRGRGRRAAPGAAGSDRTVPRRHEHAGAHHLQGPGNGE